MAGDRRGDDRGFHPYHHKSRLSRRNCGIGLLGYRNSKTLRGSGARCHPTPQRSLSRLPCWGWLPSPAGSGAEAGFFLRSANVSRGTGGAPRPDERSSLLVRSKAGGAPAAQTLGECPLRLCKRAARNRASFGRRSLLDGHGCCAVPSAASGMLISW